jgi:hypothetical protein
MQVMQVMQVFAVCQDVAALEGLGGSHCCAGSKVSWVGHLQGMLKRHVVHET